MLDYRVVTPVAVEPISRAYVKLHAKLSSDSYSGDTLTRQSLAPAARGVIAAFGLIGSSADVLDTIALVNLNAGACGTGGSVTAKIQESDDNTTWQDFTGGAFTVVTEANDNAVQEIEYTGSKRYLRVVATVAAATCVFSADVVSKTGDTTEDSVLDVMISAARGYCEGITRRAFAPQTLEVYLNYFPGRSHIELPRPPLTSVTSIIYKDSLSAENTMVASTQYLVDTDSDIGRIVLPYGVSWPSFTAYPINPIRIRYIAGYTTLPAELKQAMVLLVAHWYNSREAVGTVSGEIEFAVTALLSQYRAGWF